jgi:hypothetical protein
MGQQVALPAHTDAGATGEGQRNCVAWLHATSSAVQSGQEQRVVKLQGCVPAAGTRDLS